MAGSEMTWFIFFPLGYFLLTPFLCKRAARVKVTARGRVRGTRDFAFENDRLHHLIWVKRGDGRHERFCIWMQWLIEEFGGGCHFYQSPQIHHRHTIAYVFNNTEIMC